MAIGLWAATQDLKTTRALYEARQYDKARNDIDAVIAGKDGAKAEAWLWKHKVYWMLGTTEQYKKLVPDALQQGFEALKKARTMPGAEAAMLIELGIEINKPFNDYYTAFIGNGSAQMNAEKFGDAFNSFKLALSVSRYFYDQKMITISLDTMLTFYAGYTAMKNNDNSNTELYFRKLADNNASGADIQIAYGWLSNYYLKEKKDLATAKTIYDKGIKLYPDDEYLKSMRTQIAQQSGNPEDIFKTYEDIINSGKAQFSDYLAYGAELYDYLYVNESQAVTNVQAKEARMLEMLTKALQLKSGSAEANYIMGMHYTSKALQGYNQHKTIKGSTTEDVANRKNLQSQIDTNTGQSIKYLEISTGLYAAKTVLKENEKGHYKMALQQLLNLYKYTAQEDKLKSTEEKLKRLGQ